MSDLREKLTKVLARREAEFGRSMTPVEAAQGVIDVLPGCIKPLDFWRSDTGDLCCDTGFGRYQIQKGGARWCCMVAMGTRKRPADITPPTYHRSEQGAITAANAHHRALAMAAFGLEVKS